MPDVVAHGRTPKLFACAYCHLPNGTGRPENATLAGLPESYIIAELEAFRTSTRRSALPGYVPGNSMHTVAENATLADVESAAQVWLNEKLSGKSDRAEVIELLLQTWWCLVENKSFTEAAPSEAQRRQGWRSLADGRVVEMGWLGRKSHRQARYESLSLAQLGL